MARTASSGRTEDGRKRAVEGGVERRGGGWGGQKEGRTETALPEKTKSLRRQKNRESSLDRLLTLNRRAQPPLTK